MSIDWNRLKEIREQCRELELSGKADTQEYKDLVTEYCTVLHTSPITDDDIAWAQGKHETNQSADFAYHATIFL